MRFLILSEYFPPEVGAAQVRLLSLARELVDRGHHVEVVTGMPNYPNGCIDPQYRRRLYLREEMDGITVHRVWLYAAIGTGTARYLNYLSFSLTCILGLLKSERPDYVFVESPPLTLSFPAWLFARWWRVPLIFNVADLWPDSIRQLGLISSGAKFRLAAAIERWSYGSADYVCTVTEGLRQSLTEVKRVPAKKMLFLCNGVDTSTYTELPPDRELRSRLGLDGKQVVLYLGTVGPVHGLEQVLDAAELLQSTRPDLHVLIVGSGSAKPELVARAQAAKLRNITFLDPVSPAEVPRYMSLAFCALVTLKDTAVADGARPAKTFVAMSCAKPIVYAGNGEGARLVADADAGIVLPPGMPDRLATAILTLADNPDMRCRLGANARKYVEQQFGWKELVGSWLDQLSKPPSVAQSALKDEVIAA